MKMSEVIKPISYLKSHAAEIIRSFETTEKTFIITQNGEAKAVLQDIKTYEAMQESLALLKLLILSSQSAQRDHYKPLKKALTDIRAKIKADNSN